MGQGNNQRNFLGFLNYAQIGFSIFAAIQFPGWLRSGYLYDCFNPQWIFPNLCVPVWIPVSIAVFGSLIGGIWWTIRKYKDTGSWW